MSHWLTVRVTSGLALSCVVFSSAAAIAAGGWGAGSADGRWKPEGPGPIIGAQVDVPPNDEASGAINAVAAHPTNPDILFIGSVNGGIWRTKNATDPSPTWKQLNTYCEAQSISEIEFDPKDRRARTLVAGFGATSSLGNLSGPLLGLVRTVNNGQTWTSIGRRELEGATITGVAPRGRVIVAAARSTRPFDFPIPLAPTDGLWRSTNRGRTFKKVSGAGTGLPEGSVLDLVGDPNDHRVLYAAVAFGATAANGIYKSVNTGKTWQKVSDRALDDAINATPPGPSNLELAVGQSNNIFVSVVGSFNGAPFFGALTALFRSGDGGSKWTSLDLPSTQEQVASFGLHPGFQGAIHNSVAADPTHPNIVYLGGDRQPAYTEPNFTSPFFPNSIGAVTFGGRLFRCDASQPTGSQCVHLTDCAAGSTSPNCADPRITPAPGGGTSNDSAPHADSRHMVFDAAGNLIQVDDGGVYRLSSPASAAGAWTSVNGDLLINEQHSQAFDPVSGTNFAGTQDNGTPYQLIPGSIGEWTLWITGDGGDNAIDPSGFPLTGQGFSTRYTSAQFLGLFNSAFWDANNQNQGFFILPLEPLDGTPGPLATAQFYTPITTNAVVDGRLILGASDGVYESLDGGFTVRRVGPIQALGSGRDPLAYGAQDNPDVLYVGGGVAGSNVFDEVYVRTGAPGAPLIESTTFPGKGSGRQVRGISVNPSDSKEAFVIDDEDVYWTTDAGVTWKVVTARLARRATTPLRSVLYVPGSGGYGPSGKPRVVVGTSDGAFVAGLRRRGRFFWRPFGAGLPPTQVYNLQYNAATNTVYASTIANGSWRIKLRR